MIIIFYVIAFLIKAFFIYAVYQDLSVRFGLPLMNFLQVLMVITFLLMIKIILFSDYANLQTYSATPRANLIVIEVAKVFIMFCLVCLYCFYKSLL